MKKQLKYTRLATKAKTPAYAHKGDACFDLSVVIDEGENRPMRIERGQFAPLAPGRDGEGCHSFVVRPCESIVFHSGLAFEIPDGHVMLVFVRSSTGIKNGLVLSNGTGVIDSGYRGEVRIALLNTGIHPVKVTDGDRVAQAMIVPYPEVEMVESENLADSERGTDGIGSTGV